MHEHAPTSEFLTLDEAGARVRRTPRALRALIHRGELPARKVGKGYVILESDLLALFAPVVRPPVERRARQSSTVRALEQLAAAGLVQRAS